MNKSVKRKNNNDITNDEIVDLDKDQRLNALVIFLTIGSIVGDEFAKKYYLSNDPKLYKIAKMIFISILIATILIYIYFVKKNKEDYYEKLFNNERSEHYLIRLIGTCIIIAGFICLLYFQITDNELEGEIPL